MSASRAVINPGIKQNQVTAKRIFGVRYAEKVKPFCVAIEVIVETRGCSLFDATNLIAEHLTQTGHNSMLVYAALGDLLGERHSEQL